ncbi:hypothetical protein FBU59_006840, partial [Linderina macrospora]
MQVDVNSTQPGRTQLFSSVGFEDLTRLPVFEVVAVLECAGNRRDGLKAIKPVNGVIWGPGTASNSRWSGCRLRDLLVSIGVPKDLCHPFYATPKHVEFAGFGDAKEDKHYASSIPLEWIMNPLNMVLVAYEMNGRPLTRDHGFPARIVAPGIIGARWVKWLKYIRVQDVESDSFYQKLDYKILPPMADAHNCTEFWPRFPALMELNIQSVICRPAPEEMLQVGKPFDVQGYAFSGGGRAVDRVEVSLDGGKTWDLARIFTMQTKCKDGQRDWSAKQWAWTLWTYRIDRVPADCAISCRAWDSGGNTQPSEAVWNYRGVMNNSVYKIKPP